VEIGGRDVPPTRIKACDVPCPIARGGKGGKKGKKGFGKSERWTGWERVEEREEKDSDDQLCSAERIWGW
jgi:hypothetical protein